MNVVGTYRGKEDIFNFTYIEMNFYYVKCKMAAFGWILYHNDLADRILFCDFSFVVKVIYQP